MKYFLGIDNGGTMTKAAIYSALGDEIGVASIETKMITPRPDFTERDMEEMWEANCSVIQAVLRKTNVDAKSIAGIACCGHGKGLYLWGNNGKPVRNGIISADNRAYQFPEKWEKDGTAKALFKITYQRILACQPVSLLAWLKENEPDTIEKTQWIFECKDYIRFRLTGEARGEITDYSGANLVNLTTRQYDREILSLLGLAEMMEKLPPLCDSTEICGRVTKEAAEKTGLCEGTPVSGGMFDIDACAIAVDAARPDRICMIAGTWSINEYIRKEAVTDGSAALNSIFCIPEYYLIEESSATSAGNNEWFINTLLPELKEQANINGECIYDVMSELVDSIAADEYCPIFTPFLMSSNVHPKAKASFVGLSNYHTRAHLMRSIYEGIAFSHKYHFEKLMTSRNVSLSSIQLAGGAAKSRVWSQMFADVMAYPVSVVDVNETGALGCAMTAAVATGEYSDFTQAAQNMVHIKEKLIPRDANVAAYQKKYVIYKQVLQSLDGIWDDIQKLM